MIDDSLSLEKLKIDERLRNVEIQTSRLISHVESERGTLSRFHADIMRILDEMKDIVKKHEKIIFGEDGHGLILRQDRLEQIEEMRKSHLKAIWVSLVGLATKYLFDIFKK